MLHWLMKFEVESHLRIATTGSRLTFKHPKGLYTVHIENSPIPSGPPTLPPNAFITELPEVQYVSAPPLLDAFIIFKAEDIEHAPEAGAKYLRHFLDLLSFSTGSRFQIYRRVCLYDWTPGDRDRHGRIYREYPDPNIPWAALSQELLDSVQCLFNVNPSDEVLRAFHSFALGVSSGPPDQQFQMFWFSIETLAQLTRDKEPNSDRCPVCREPLYCGKCKVVPKHRPYPKQAIEQLFQRHVTGRPDLAFEASNAMRNALLHGDSIVPVEAKHNVTLTKLVDVVGRIAWAALLKTLVSKTDGQSEPVEASFIQPTTFVHYKSELVAKVSFRTSSGKDPDLQDLPKTKIAIYSQ